MLIDPISFTLDANERSVLADALDAFIATKTRTLAQLKGRDQKSRDAIDRVEMIRARAQDLHERIA